MPLPDRGSLDRIPIPRLLLELYRERFEGALTLQRERVSKRVLLSAGVPVVVESSRERDRLVEQLRESGRLDSDAAARANERARRKNGKEAAALLELGLIGARDLLDALRDQVRRALLECFSWSTGEFSLDSGVRAPADTAPLRGDLPGLVEEGIRTRWAPERLFAELAANLSRYPVLTSAAQPWVQWAEQREAGRGFLAAIDGAHTLDAAVRESGSVSALTLAWILDAAGAVEYRAAPAAAEAPGEEEGEQVTGSEPEALEIVIESTRGEPAEREAPATRSGPLRSAPPERPASHVSSAQAEALRREVLEKHAALAELDHYAVLGLERNASSAEIKQAYFSAAKRFHPDGLARLGLEDLKSAANEVFARIAKAYESLSDAHSRRDYDASLEGEDDALDGARLVQAETLYRKGEVLLRAGSFRGALEFLRPAVELWPSDAAYQASLGWALFRKNPSEPKAARQHLEQALHLDPKLAQAHLWLGQVLKDLGETQAARDAVAQAKQLDPKLR